MVPVSSSHEFTHTVADFHGISTRLPVKWGYIHFECKPNFILKNNYLS